MLCTGNWKMKILAVKFVIYIWKYEKSYHCFSLFAFVFIGLILVHKDLNPCELVNSARSRAWGGLGGQRYQALTGPRSEPRAGCTVRFFFNRTSFSRFTADPPASRAWKMSHNALSLSNKATVAEICRLKRRWKWMALYESVIRRPSVHCWLCNFRLPQPSPGAHS